MFLLIILLGAGTAMASESAILWQDYEKGMADSQAQSKKVFVYFFADWCKYCKLMDKETFGKPAVADYLNKNFIPIRINSEKNPKLASQFFVRGLPMTWFITESGEKVGGRPGFVSAKDLLPALEYIYTDSFKKMSYGDFMDQKK